MANIPTLSRVEQEPCPSAQWAPPIVVWWLGVYLAA